MNMVLADGMRELSAAEILMVSGGESDGGDCGGGGGDCGDGGGGGWDGGGWDGGWGGGNISGSSMDGFNEFYTQPPGDYSYSLSMECVRNTAYAIAAGYVGAYSITGSNLKAVAMGIIGGLGAIGTSCFNDNGGSGGEGSR